MPQVFQYKDLTETIFDHLLCKSDSLSGIGLYSGAFGRLLFLAHYLQYHPKENNGCSIVMRSNASMRSARSRPSIPTAMEWPGYWSVCGTSRGAAGWKSIIRRSKNNINLTCFNVCNGISPVTETTTCCMAQWVWRIISVKMKHSRRKPPVGCTARLFATATGLSGNLRCLP